MAPITQILSWIVRDVYYGWSPLPLPPAGSFAGQTVCVVGGSTGLGLAAAEHCVNLGAAEVIITSRGVSRAGAAKEYLEKRAAAVASTAGASECRVTGMILDMNRYDSVVAFAEDLKKIKAGRGGIDFILLNAAVIQSRFLQSPEGWQEELQVNTLSSVLLALLLMPWLRAERKNRTAPAHLAFTTSSASLTTDVSKWEGWSLQNGGEGILNHWNKKETWPPGLKGGYPISKAMLMYAGRELIKLAVGPDGR